MIKTLNSFRFILILMIVMSHSALPTSLPFRYYLGKYAVVMFFIISGFVLSLSYGERLVKEEVSNKRFFLTRISKLYPLHLLILLIIIPLDYRLELLCPWYQTMAHALLLQSWVPTHQFVGALNIPTWFMSDLIIYYLMFKYLYRWNMQSKKALPLTIYVIYIAAYIVLTMTVEGDKSADYINLAPPSRIIDFSLGIMLYRFYRSEKGKKVYAFIANRLTPWQEHLADIAIILISVGMYYLSIYTNPNFRCAALYWLPSVVIIFYIIASDQGKGWLTLLFHQKALLWLGSISFEIFICHSLCFRVIQSVFIRVFGENNPYWAMNFTLALALTILVSWMSKKYVVTPCSNYLKKYVK
jgi:peptidoglycan/LPS O-acetylase OafA/YrhL